MPSTRSRSKSYSRIAIDESCDDLKELSMACSEVLTHTAIVHYDAPMPILQPGSTAPAFALQSGLDQPVSLADFRGRNVVLVFYPFDWSPVCSDQLALYNELLEEFASLDAQVLAISVDSLWCHAAFARDRKYRFPLLADFEPKGQVARAYGAYEPHEGAAERALFVIDGSGVIRWSYLSPMDVNPGADGILEALESLK
jgi:peroxiredoxin